MQERIKFDVIVYVVDNENPIQPKNLNENTVINKNQIGDEEFVLF